MNKLFRVFGLIIIVMFATSCSSDYKKKDVEGNWQISEIIPEEGWEVLHIDKFYLDFDKDSVFLVHGGKTTSYLYRLVENKLMLNETMPYGTIVAVGSGSMQIDLNNSKYSFVFEKR